MDFIATNQSLSSSGTCYEIMYDFVLPSSTHIDSEIDETMYLMSSEKNYRRIQSALKSNKGSKTYKNLEDFRSEYGL